ncbi:MAG: peptide ABC transporter substrate-binding protein [Patescibacteria group bacterium]|nr:peptide ABC transporter substrate-binding protein [Patescibacteria group bacterium]
MAKFIKIIHSFSKKELIIFIAAVVLAVLSALSISVIYLAKSAKLVPVAGGEYTEGMVGQPVDINPVTARSETDQALVHLMFTNLYSVASTIQPDANSQTWDVRLKDNVFWQDGQKLTSDDVIFTIDSIQNPDSNSPLFSSWQGIAANRVSELEIQFVLSSPYVFFKNNLKNLYILPKHLYADVPVANWRLSDYNLKPIGSGPYKFVDFDKQPNGFINDYYLQASDNYFAGKPLISNFNIKFFANQDDLIKDFNAGKIDGAGGIPTSVLGSLKRPYELTSFNLPSYYAVFFNQNISLALKEAAVRQALSMVVDRNSIISSVFGGRATAVSGPIPPFLPEYDSSSSPAAFNASSTEEAAALLDQDGWKMNPADGYREKIVKGTKVGLQFNLVVPDEDFLMKTANILQSEWQSIGAQVNIVSLSPDDVSQAVKYRNYQMFLFGNILNPPADLYAFWDSSESNYPGLNLALYSNTNVDNLIGKIRRESDPAARQILLNSLQEAIVSDAPAVFLYSPDYLYISNKDLGGIPGGYIDQPINRFDSILKWFIQKAIVIKNG